MLLPLSHVALLMASFLAPASTTPRPPAAAILLAQTNPIKGADPMGDKGRSGPDGWIQAPIARDAAASGSDKAPGETQPSRASTPSKPAAEGQMKAGDDPGTPTDPTKADSPGNAPK
jgi:hypothetical protein